ncbi:LamG-like jellyroll fold domain-containing protein [Planctomycetota bacterium]
MANQDNKHTIMNIFALVFGATIFIQPLTALSQVLNLPDALTVTVPINNEIVELNLYKYSIRATDFRVRCWTEQGGYEEIERPLLRTYRGTVSNKPNLRVLAAILPGGRMKARATAGKMDVWEIDVNVADQIAMFPSGQSNGKESGHGATIVRAKARQPSGRYPPTGPIQMVQIGTDIRRDCVDKQGGWEGALAYAEYELSRVDEYYTRDIGLAFELTEVVIRLDKFYMDSNGKYLKGGILNKLRTTWRAELPGNWDYVHGFWGHGGGRSGVGTPFSFGAALHEIGHNLYMEHPNYGWQMQNPLSHENGIAQRDNINGACTDLPSRDFQEPIHPHASIDIAVVRENEPEIIDVLENDWDSNGESISIMYFTPQTVPGAEVTLTTVSDDISGERQALLYTPPAGYVGKDLLIYTVQNETGLHNTEIVHIYVLGDPNLPAASWPFEEIVEQTTPDVSPYGYDARLSDGCKCVPGQTGQAIEVPAGGYIICGDTDVLPDIPDHWDPIGVNGAGNYPLETRANNLFDPLDTDFSVCFRFQPVGYAQETNAAIQLLGKSNPKDRGVGYRISADRNGIHVRFREWGGRFRKLTRSVRYDTPIEADQWYHVAVVFDRSSNQGQLWVNGNRCPQTLPLVKDSFIFAGRSDTVIHNGSPVPCVYDDVQIFYRTLSPVEIQDISGM